MTGTVVPRDSDSEANAELLVLSESEFADAVRHALRDLTRPDVLAGSPLVRSRLIHTRAQGAPASDTLARVVLEAAAQLRAHPKDEKLYRALDRTFLRPAPTQERAAEILDLPFSTYRRHLAQGIERIVADLWNQELHAGDIA